MGYTTDFVGKFKITPTLNAAQVMYLRKFSETRRMKRDAKVCETLRDPIRGFVKLPVGEQGGYYVGGSSYSSDREASVIDNNEPPKGQPGLWCQWVPTDDGEYLEWDGGEKFYNYVEWLNYLITHFFKVWGCTLNGEVEWQGESMGDRGTIVVENNEVSIAEFVKRKPIKLNDMHDKNLYASFLTEATDSVRELWESRGEKLTSDECDHLKEYLDAWFQRFIQKEEV